MFPGAVSWSNLIVELHWRFVRARGSAVDHPLHTRGVGGSIPPAPTSLRSLRELRLGKPSSCPAIAALAAKADGWAGSASQPSRQSPEPGKSCLVSYGFP